MRTTLGILCLATVYACLLFARMGDQINMLDRAVAKLQMDQGAQASKLHFLSMEVRGKELR